MKVRRAYWSSNNKREDGFRIISRESQVFLYLELLGYLPRKSNSVEGGVHIFTYYGVQDLPPKKPKRESNNQAKTSVHILLHVAHNHARSCPYYQHAKPQVVHAKP